MSSNKFRTKFAVSYEALLDGELPWLGRSASSSSASLTTTTTPLASSYSNTGSYFSPKGKKPSAPRARFYADILCLKVEARTIEDLMRDIPPRLLLDDEEGGKGARIRDNIGSLWRECLRVWSDVDTNAEISFSAARYNLGSASDEVRRCNAVDTLLVLSRSVLAKSALTQSSTSLDLIWIFAGGIDEADDVFESLVTAIDEGLRGELDSIAHQIRQQRTGRLPSSDIPRQHSNGEIPAQLPTLQELLHHRIRAVQLAIVWVSYVSSTNLAAYFVRRDLFVAAGSLLSTVQSILGSVQGRADREGGDQLAELDEQLLQSVVRDATFLIGLLAGLGHEAPTSSGGGTGAGASMAIASSSYNAYFRRLCDWVDSGSMSLLCDSIARDFESGWKAYEAVESPFAQASASSWSSTASLGAVAESVKFLGFGRTSSAVAESTADFPPRPCCALLSVYLLTKANEAFVQIALSTGRSGLTAAKRDNTGSNATFASSFFSICSYLTTHGSLSDRSKSYSRLSLLTYLALLSSTAGTSAMVLSDRQEDIQHIQQCQQKSGPKPVRNVSTPEGAIPGITGYLSSFSLASVNTSTKKPTRLLPFILDSCIHYLRFNLRKRLDVSGYLVCLEVIKLSIDSCAQHKLMLEYASWVEIWRSIQTVVQFLVGRHTELRGIEIGRLGKALLTTLSLALIESDKFLPHREDITLLIYELIRSSESLRRMACIAVTGKDPVDMSSDSSASYRLQEQAEKIVESIYGWRLVDMVLLTFEDRLREWQQKKGAGAGFSLGFSMSSLTGGYFSKGKSQEQDGGAVPTPPITSSTSSMPDTHTVMDLIASLDLERLIATVGGTDRSKGDKRGPLVDQEWLERVESQCISEAFRCTSEDMRIIIAASP